MSKDFGVFYTPQNIVEFVITQLQSTTDFLSIDSILEPSAGDGRFAKAVFQSLPNKLVTSKLIEINESSCESLKSEFEGFSGRVEIENSDFLYCELESGKYDLVIGNPPYISKKRLNDEQLVQFRNILDEFDIPHSADKNIWTAFILKCEASLKTSGVMAFILPFELLQVKFTESIQHFLEKRFERIDIYTFQSLVFDTAGQDTVLLVAHKKHADKGLFVFDVECPNKSTNEEDAFFTPKQLCRRDVIKQNGMKWSSLILSDEDLHFLNQLSMKFNTVGDCLVSRPGVVTAANDFFIVNEKTVNDYKLHQYAKPVVQKGLYVNGRAVFGTKEHEELVTADKPSFFLDFNAYEQGTDKLVEDYLASGLLEELEQRFKCKQREYWYKVPVVEPGAGFFFKRSNEYPKLLKNSSSVYTTDTAYNIYPQKGFKVNSIIYSFYNPLTLCFAELLGRHYGGGVLELIPSEFRKLPLPYSKVNSNTFNRFSRAFDKKESILDVLEQSGRELLLNVDCINDCEIDRLMVIYKTLVNRRFSKSRKGTRYN